MRINIKEKEYFLEVFKDYFNQSFDFPINGISIDSRNIKKNEWKNPSTNKLSVYF